MATSTTPTVSDWQPRHVQTTLSYHLDVALGGASTYQPGSYGSYRRKFDRRTVTVHDIRGNEADYDLNKQGFQLYRHRSVEKDFRDEEKIKNEVYPETERLLMQATGATKVHVFSHIIRRASRDVMEAIAKKADMPDSTDSGKVSPARWVHIDQSDDGAMEVLEDNMDAEAARTLQRSRWSIINVWRPIRPISKDPLAVCDARSIPDDDLVPVTAILPPKGSGTFENVTAGKRFETLEAKAGSSHRWYYASGMTPDEVLFIKCFDSSRDKDLARRVPHTSFQHPDTKEEDTTRESIELRCLVFYEDQSAE